MEIRFTRHALVRCKEQGFTPMWVQRQLRKMPKFKGKLKWRLEDGNQLVFESTGQHILLITIIGIKKNMRGKKERNSRVQRLDTAFRARRK